MQIEIAPIQHPLKGIQEVPGDKSISHRALMFGALAQGETRIRGLLDSADVRSTQAILTALGVQFKQEKKALLVQGVGGQFSDPRQDLDCGNSGTTMRLMMGLLAGSGVAATLIGDASLSQRPMGRVANPLTEMGANFTLREGRFPPVQLSHAPLHAISYALPMASAQVKSALLLAGLFAKGTTRLTGLIDSRDHTERLLPHFGVELSCTEAEIALQGGQNLHGANVYVPGDPSSAAFWLTAAALVPNSRLTLKNISLNPTRQGLVHVLQRMGAQIETETVAEYPEPRGHLTIHHAPLKGTLIQAKEIASLIDEIPLIALLATQAQGSTEVKGAEEMRVKESDRLAAIEQNLNAMGIELESRSDGFLIQGPQSLQGAQIETFHDHRIAMTFALAGLVAQGITTIPHAECVAISYPSFFKELAIFAPDCVIERQSEN